MFLQKLRLDSDKSYSTSTTLENIVENLLLGFKRVVIITLYSKESDSEDKIVDLENRIVTITLAQLKQHRQLFDCSHIIVPQLSLFSSFGHTKTDFPMPIITTEQPSAEGSIFQLEDLSYALNGQLVLSPLQLCKFFVKAEKDERFVVLYLIAQMYPTTVVSRFPERVRMFARIMSVDIEVVANGEEVIDAFKRCIVCLDGCQTMPAERVFVVGTKSAEIQSLVIDVNSAGKFKYRIMDVMRRLSHSAVKRKKDFDYSVFKNINV